MSLLNIFKIAGSGMSAQSQRLNVVASNLANADSTTGPDGTVYKAKQLEFSAVPVSSSKEVTGVKVNRIIEDKTAPRQIYNPAHPQADANGFVSMPNVNVADEMVNMISASRSYQNNVDTLNAAKTLINKTLTLGQ